MFKGKLIVLVGPTASGKTDIAIQLAKQFNSVIISADSRQFYKEIPIGTAAPDKGQLTEIPHYFVGNLSIKNEYNVSMFENDVLGLLDSTLSSHEYVIMTGGSGLYIDAVCKGIDELPDVDSQIRSNIKDIYNDEGIDSLRNLIQNLDPDYYEIVDLNNPIRLMRAIEVCMQTGMKYSELRKNKPAERNFPIIKHGLLVPREELVERINTRTDQMINSGWIDEARGVVEFRNHNSLKTVGYKELFKYFDGEYSLEFAVEKIKTNTRRYAKRQMTWFRRDSDIQWFSPKHVSKMISYIESMG